MRTGIRKRADLLPTASATRSDEARGHLARAIQTYLEGYRADFRDAYPGINAATLMECEAAVRPEQAEILPVVLYAAKQRLASVAPDYWDYATTLELRVLARDQTGADEVLAAALAMGRESWEFKTTADNLQYIVEARAGRGEDVKWIEGIVTELRNRAKA